MDRLRWIDTDGGPLVLVSDKSIGLWSGILDRGSYLNNISKEAEDFLDPEQADYGRACLIRGYLGLTKVGEDDALVLGDEPMQTTFINLSGKPVLVRCFYAESEISADNAVANIEVDSIDSWEFAVSIRILSDKQYLFDSACSKSMFANEGEDYLQINLKPGLYRVSTSVFEPDTKTKLILHKFERTN